jgi:hypothetical protein
MRTASLREAPEDPKSGAGSVTAFRRSGLATARGDGSVDEAMADVGMARSAGKRGNGDARGWLGGGTGLARAVSSSGGSTTSTPYQRAKQ